MKRFRNWLNSPAGPSEAILLMGIICALLLTVALVLLVALARGLAQGVGGAGFKPSAIPIPSRSALV